MRSQYNVKCSSFLPVKYNALRKILQHTEAVVPSLNELKSSIALKLKLLHLQEFTKLFPPPHYFEISNLPSTASAIQTKYIRHKSCNNHFTWNFCTIHPRHRNYFTVLHIHIAPTHTHTHKHTESVINHLLFCIQILSTFLEFSTTELQPTTVNSHSSVMSENQKHVIKSIWLKVMRSIVSCSLVHISQDAFIQARLQEAHS
jgi:hypothetical protein